MHLFSRYFDLFFTGGGWYWFPCARTMQTIPPVAVVLPGYSFRLRRADKTRAIRVTFIRLKFCRDAQTHFCHQKLIRRRDFCWHNLDTATLSPASISQLMMAARWDGVDGVDGVDGELWPDRWHPVGFDLPGWAVESGTFRGTLERPAFESCWASDAEIRRSADPRSRQRCVGWPRSGKFGGRWEKTRHKDERPRQMGCVHHKKCLGFPKDVLVVD